MSSIDNVNIRKILWMMSRTAVVRWKNSNTIYFVHSTFWALCGYYEQWRFRAHTWEFKLTLCMTELKNNLFDSDFELLFDSDD